MPEENPNVNDPVTEPPVDPSEPPVPVDPPAPPVPVDPPTPPVHVDPPTPPAPGDPLAPVFERGVIRDRTISFQMLVAFLLTLFVALIVFCVFRTCGDDEKCLSFIPVLTNRNPVQLWLFYMLVLLLLCVFTGRGITTYWWGVLIDQRNKISLARLQLVLWTLVILSGYLIAVIINVCLGKEQIGRDPLNIMIDEQLWALMGISGASLAGSGLIKTVKSNQKVDETQAKAKYAREMSDNANPLTPVNTTATDVMKRTKVEGVVVGNNSAKDASWLDLFVGDELGSAAWLDVGKMQMFLFTLIVWFTYVSSMVKPLHEAVLPGSKGIESLPSLGQGMITLLAISHAAYLTNKAVPQTSTSTQPSGGSK
jgi:hypothetical protein